RLGKSFVHRPAREHLVRTIRRLAALGSRLRSFPILARRRRNFRPVGRDKLLRRQIGAQRDTNSQRKGAGKERAVHGSLFSIQRAAILGRRAPFVSYGKQCWRSESLSQRQETSASAAMSIYRQS